jgi:hypothetical protein
MSNGAATAVDPVGTLPLSPWFRSIYAAQFRNGSHYCGRGHVPFCDVGLQSCMWGEGSGEGKGAESVESSPSPALSSDEVGA